LSIKLYYLLLVRNYVKNSIKVSSKSALIGLDTSSIVVFGTANTGGRGGGSSIAIEASITAKTAISRTLCL